MIFIDSFIYSGMKNILGEENSYASYPDNFNTFPLGVYSVEENSQRDRTLDNEEISSNISFRIDIWDKVESDLIFEKIEKLNEYFTKTYNFKRTFCQQVPDVDELTHYVIRFNGIVDINSFK